MWPYDGQVHDVQPGLQRFRNSDKTVRCQDPADPRHIESELIKGHSHRAAVAGSSNESNASGRLHRAPFVEIATPAFSISSMTMTGLAILCWMIVWIGLPGCADPQPRREPATAKRVYASYYNVRIHKKEGRRPRLASNSLISCGGVPEASLPTSGSSMKWW